MLRTVSTIFSALNHLNIFVLTNLIRVRRIQQGHAYSPTFLLLFFLTPATAQQPFAKVRGDKTMAIVLLILVVLFLALGILSIYTRQCADRRLRGRLDLAILAAAGSIGSRSRRQQRGLDQAVVDSFPTFAYPAVKGHKIGRDALECAVCLGEFRDDETLRLIPDCRHVFHPDCIDVWLSTHSTCPVCRANLVPIPGDTSSSSLAIDIFEQPDPEPNNNGSNLVSRVNDDYRNRVVLLAESQSRLERSTSLDDESRSVRAFRRSNSTGHSPVQAGEDSERFTLRLPERVRPGL